MNRNLIGIILASALLLPTVGSAQSGSIASLFKGAIPQVSSHVSKIAANGKGLAVKAVCLASACMLAFTVPDAGAVEPAPASVSEQATFLGEEIKTNWWIGTGMYMDNSGKLITTRVGTQLEVGDLKSYMTVAVRTHPDMIDGIDAIDSKTRLYAGFTNTVIAGETFSYLVSDNNLFVNGDRTIFHTARNYLLQHSFDGLGANVELALLGHEYTDPNAWQTLEDAQTMRINNASLFRTNITFANLIASDLIKVGAKFNASLGAGDIGIAKLGEVYQAELLDWAGGDDVELVHNLLTRGSADLSLRIGQHLTLGTGVDVTRTIGGAVENSRAVGGNFDITRRIIRASAEADILPQHGITFTYNGEWYKQTIDSSIWQVDGSEDFDLISRGIFGRATVNVKY
ncbi:MAG: hypothetical protein OYH77_02620 [Pseudomonadota bacterium]|nr:hypothetical protein [Pseudomonadota bacterium]